MSRGAHYLAINYLYLHLTNSVLLATILIKYSMNGLVDISPIEKLLISDYHSGADKLTNLLLSNPNTRSSLQ